MVTVHKTLIFATPAPTQRESSVDIRGRRCACTRSERTVLVTRIANMGATHSEPSENNELVSRIKAHLATVEPATARALGGVFLFNIIKEQSVYSWTLDLNNVTVYEGEPDDDPDTTFTLGEHTFKQLVLGKEAARTVMQAGRCSVTGDITRAMRLEPYVRLQ